MSTPAEASYTVAVRELAEFAAKAGDLDLRFTPAPTAQEGIAGHKAVVARRGADYRSEVSLQGSHKHLVVRGRADGYDAQRQLLEEVKTFRGEFERMPDNHRQLHWAQAKVYGWLLCGQSGLSELTISLVYFDIGRQTETVLSEHHTAAALEQFFVALCERFLAWADQELAHRGSRDAALGSLCFPHPSFRAGQRQLAEAVFRATRLGRCLMAQAPTGIGKTMGTIFPLMKACPEQELDKVFFLTAKGSGAALALDAVDTLRSSQPGLPWRVVELVARDKACEHPDKACHGDSCPLARSFYDRLPQAREAAVLRAGAHTLTKEVLREVALAHQVCPYYLSQELVRWSDMVVGDYNYVYDSGALLHALTQANQWRVAVLVDEAHNLVDRARSMYTATLDLHALRRARLSAPPPVRKTLDRLHRAWRATIKEQTQPYRAHAAVPDKLARAVRDSTSAIGELLSDAHDGIAGELLDFHFDALHFTSLVDSFGEHSLFDVSVDRAGTGASTRTMRSSLCVRNVIPAPFLKPRFAGARTTILFSATLTPQHFYSDTLGLPDDTACIDVEPPFAAEQLSVRIARRVSTRYEDRAASLAPIAELMARQYEAQPGNYLAFFSSFDYLRQAAAMLSSRQPAIPMWEQTRGMGEREREQFLARFAADGCGIGFAVLGGSFAEGIDLPGSRLIGAFIATLGLPQVNPINEEMKRRIHATFGTGYDYAYLFPGIRKVVQAAGRVIRTPNDRGTVHLIDDRFARPEVRRLLPAWWRIEGTGHGG